MNPHATIALVEEDARRFSAPGYLDRVREGERFRRSSCTRAMSFPPTPCALVTRVPAATFALVPDASHHPWLQAPDAVRSALVTFFESLSVRFSRLFIGL